MRIAFIGVGGIAKRYLNSVEELKQPIAAVCDINEQRAAEVAAARKSKLYTNHCKMLAEVKPDVVFISVPPFAHDTQVIDCAKAGAALFVAKPVALDLDNALRMRDAIAKAGVINQTGYMARYSDITEKARELAAGRTLNMGLGRFICSMPPSHPWWGKKKMSGGQIVEQSTHIFDWLRYFLGEAVETHSYGHRGGSEDIADFEDSSVCNVRFAGGAIASVHSTCCTKPLEMFTTELTGRAFHLKATMDTKLDGKIDDQTIEYTGTETGYHRQVAAFLKAVESGDQAAVRTDYENAVRSLAVTLAADRSLASGKPEKVPAV